MKLITFPKNTLANIPAGLRKLAEEIEDGEFNDAHNLAWVIDCGDGVINVGMLGESPSPGAEAYYLYGLAKRVLEES